MLTDRENFRAEFQAAVAAQKYDPHAVLTAFARGARAALKSKMVLSADDERWLRDIIRTAADVQSAAKSLLGEPDLALANESARMRTESRIRRERLRRLGVALDGGSR